MVALAIISIALVSIYRLQSQTISMTNATKFYAIAPMLAQKKISEIEINKDINANGTGDFGDSFSGYKFNVSVSSVTSDILGDASDKLRQIDIKIIFNNEEFIYNVKTYRFIEEKY